MADGEAAWDILRGESPPKLAILDWMMPRLDGLEVCRRLRALPARADLRDHPDLEGRQGEHRRRPGERGRRLPDQAVRPRTSCSPAAGRPADRRLQTSQTVVFAFARAVEAKSPYTQGHSERVTALRPGAGRAGLAGRPTEKRDVLRRGALLHDIGKISIPDAILEQARPADRRTSTRSSSGTRPRGCAWSSRCSRCGSDAVDPLAPRAARRPRLPGRAARRADPAGWCASCRWPTCTTPWPASGRTAPAMAARRVPAKYCGPTPPAAGSTRGSSGRSAPSPPTNCPRPPPGSGVLPSLPAAAHPAFAVV